MDSIEIAEHKYLRITWGAAAFAVGTLIGVVLWLSSVDSKAADALQRLDRQKDSIKDIREDVKETKERTIRMESTLNFLKERYDRESN